MPFYARDSPQLVWGKCFELFSIHFIPIFGRKNFTSPVKVAFEAAHYLVHNSDDSATMHVVEFLIYEYLTLRSA